MHRVLLIPILVGIVFLVGCSTGYTGETGGHLKTYLEPEAMKRLLETDHPDILVIDVRPATAYLRGHLPGAMNVPSPDFPEWFERTRPGEDIIVYCETGGRAQGVVKYLEEQGVDNVMNWGGYTRWEWDYEVGDHSAVSPHN